MRLDLLLFLITLRSASSQFKPFDFVENALTNYVNHSVDPCDSFIVMLAPLTVLRILSTMNSRNYLNILRKFKRTSTGIIFSLSCNQKNLNLLTGTNTTESELCIEVSKNIVYSKKWEDLINFNKAANQLFNLVGSISTHLDGDVRPGIEEVRDMALKMLDYVKTTIKVIWTANLLFHQFFQKTPWAKNKNVVAKIEELTSQIYVFDNYGKDFKDATNWLFKIEKAYLECKTKFRFIENSDLYCYITKAMSVKFPTFPEHFFTYHNAFNGHPEIIFGFPIYYHMQHGKELASKLGFCGTLIGHEIGHTLIGLSEGDRHLPYFSDEATGCIQNQFNRTCHEYKEKSCDTTDEYFEENGSDMFGTPLAYQLLENLYGNRIDELIERINVTNRQLFFYSYAFSFCSVSLVNKFRDYFAVQKHQSYVRSKEERDGPPHSARNVRINVVANHPAFKEAFKCSDDSRMMRSATEQCHIYGKDAPETRRKNVMQNEQQKIEDRK
ncbi:hypothetical protein CAEBREN_16520 [Caenorhabditis brenneri]|uniref:Peptidase M13 C-terminal domain-containing protein n=1 Tax=Caenorhabditis brenneri TaxID=135651 RepID=G0NNC4_CAEBE|nr:hypothetical protein CAEBREN_16520 [Caenorhabditis brenneri]